jgi:DNA-directed RNA polymerase specialized sigma subunit
VQYQTAAVHVPVRVRELGAKLSRVKQQMQQQQNGREPSVEALAAAAGVSVQQAQRALAATGRALQVRGLACDRPQIELN